MLQHFTTNVDLGVQDCAKLGKNQGGSKDMEKREV